MLAVQYQDNYLTIVLNDPLDNYGIEDIRQTTGMNLEIWLTELLPLNQAIEYYYSEIEAKKAASSANEMAREREQALEVNADEGDSDAPVIKLLDNLLARAFSMNASDIHIEPFEEKTSVRIRVDLHLLHLILIQKSLHQNLIARVKILGQMDIAEKRLPQDGHFRTRIANRDVNIRTSVIPTVFGEKAVLRLLASGNMVADAETFGMNQAHFEQFSKMLEAPNGMIYITGPTGSGKTTFLNALSQFIPREERIITIEDSAELQLIDKPNLVRLETRNANTEGVLPITIRDLIKTALRMRPNRVIVGECRGAEALDVLQAMNTGHDGSLSTGHANSCKDMLSRLETMVLMGMELPLPAIRSQIASGIDILIHLGRMRDKSRKVLSITEIAGYEENNIILNDIYRFKEEKAEENTVHENTVHRAMEKVGDLIHTEKMIRAGYCLDGL